MAIDEFAVGEVAQAAKLNLLVNQLNLLPQHMEYGQAVVNVTAVNTPTSLAVTFATAFTTAPVVSLTVMSGAPAKVSVSYNAASTSGFTIWVNRTDGAASTTVSWAALGS